MFERTNVPPEISHDGRNYVVVGASEDDLTSTFASLRRGPVGPMRAPRLGTALSRFTDLENGA